MRDLGRRIYGAAAIALGLVGLAWGAFATVWQPVQDYTPFRTPLAYLTALVLIGAGTAVQFRRSAPPALLVLAAVFAAFALLWAPRVIGYPQIVATWAGFAEQFAVAIAGVLAWLALQGREAPRLATVLRVAFGICAVFWAFNHFTNIPQTSGMVPAWIPGRTFWAWATGFGHLAAGLALISCVMAVLAARLLAAMFLVFQLCIWVPGLFAVPANHVVWAGNAVNLTAIAAAWVLAEFLEGRSRQGRVRSG
ncbi:MAG TPA: hypothetical protein VGB62_07805 [Allosphingosinicella sp.]|jgi:uncharacterized membrane protein YphA (DoxX/SURF4 family)